MPFSINVLHDDSLVYIEEGVENDEGGNHHCEGLHKSELEVVQYSDSAHLV